MQVNAFLLGSAKRGKVYPLDRCELFRHFRSLIIYGDRVETLKPILEIIRKNMLLLFSVFNFKENMSTLSITFTNINGNKYLHHSFLATFSCCLSFFNERTIHEEHKIWRSNEHNDESGRNLLRRHYCSSKGICQYKKQAAKQTR